MNDLLAESPILAPEKPLTFQRYRIHWKDDDSPEFKKEANIVNSMLEGFDALKTLSRYYQNPKSLQADSKQQFLANKDRFKDNVELTKEIREDCLSFRHVDNLLTATTSSDQMQEAINDVTGGLSPEVKQKINDNLSKLANSSGLLDPSQAQIIYALAVQELTADIHAKSQQLMAQTLGKPFDVDYQQLEITDLDQLKSLRGSIPGGLFHDLGNNIMAMRSIIQLLDRKEAKGLVTETNYQDVYQDFIERAAVNSYKMFNRLRDSDPELRGEVEEVGLNGEQIAEISRRLVFTDERYKDRLKFDVMIDPPAKHSLIKWGPKHLSRTLETLINNSLVHGLAHKITLHLSVDASRGTLTVAVIDDGRGLPAEIEEKGFTGNSIQRADEEEVGHGVGVEARQRELRAWYKADLSGINHRNQAGQIVGAEVAITFHDVKLG